MRARLAPGLPTLAGAAFAGAALAGCVPFKHTPEARFFALRPVAEAPSAAASPSAAGVVGVLPVSLPGHLARPQLVAWSGPGEVRINEFLRWAEPLDGGVLRVLAENLETLLPSQRIVKAPWSSSTPLLCRVRVELVRFGPQPGGEVALSGRFILLTAHGERALVSRAADLRRDLAAGPDDPGRAVEAMSALLADLARQIADAVVTLPPDPAAKPAEAGKTQ